MEITITDYQDNWPDMFAREKENISRILAFLNPAIVHIGSTSVPGLCAKPVIDIQVGLKDADDLDRTIGPMQQDYTYVKMFEPDWPSRRYYCRYESEKGGVIPSLIYVNDVPSSKQGLISLTHIHVFVKDTDDWIRHIAFRDYLEAHPHERNAYCQLKKELSKVEYENMIAYKDAKNDFVKEVQQKAVTWYKKLNGIN
ncbi:GrpB domain, predicted nucleotidyltransferase, UPF0157 family [Mucilaginibacter lappiensis]|uniref:GrpB-like predicted nucleotidyltransferase (UPF0157 family) n=1 Tax=Mucilaginibacter lappiensis TaxID=354630 RepID=A0ABR6PQL7_9SPHI|nr:GrpB family protein [Mucilaginibacter lappiensis]MBB6111300.1 GrpB-like predicted nucleotidyltransferase (UPF0157 family) [Mucilaginibacter lappiensis]SIR74994.1 GrpB domain, predicted nucleotidyltransferase, UPF0157 family [Mucilaginibacter lappiensis]